MAFCKNCGTEIPEGVKFCPSCGTPVETEKAGTGSASSGFFKPEDVTHQFDKTDIEANKWISVLSYLGPLVFVPLFARKNSPYAQFHAKQGVTVFGIEVILSIVGMVLAILIKIPVIKWLGYLAYIPYYVIGIAASVIAIYAIVNVLRGFARKLLFIGDKIDIYRLFK